MPVRISLSRAIQPDGRKASKSVVRRIKLWMLAGENQPGRNSARVERLGNGGELDRFGTSADND
jgi:hypothetical protein